MLHGSSRCNTLTRKDLGSYDTGREALERCVDRARCLEVAGATLGEGALERLIVKATVERRAFDELGGDPELMVEFLRQEYAIEWADPDGSIEQALVGSPCIC